MNRIETQAPPSPNGRHVEAAPPAAVQFVTLDQAAALVHLTKATLKRYVSRMPPAYRPGKKRRPALWAWHDLRPWLAETFGMTRLPERLP